MKKALVIYATAGAGHRKAAEAIYEGLQSLPDVDAVLVDSLDHTSRFYKYSYSNVYTFLITKVPFLWGFMFQLLDVPFLLPFVRFARRMRNSLHGAALNKYLKQEQFDYIFSTHFFPNEVAAHLKRKGAIKSEIICVVTDYDVHSIWLSDGIDKYAVASEWTRKKIMSLGVEEDNILVTGIPTLSKFSSYSDISELKQKLGVKDGVFTVLVATGSFGFGPIEEIIQHLPDFQVVVVCGHNKELYSRLSKQEKELVKICGLVDNMDELMAVADVMITKPGGLSISEALVSGLPLIFFSAIPGQETNNVNVLKEHGIGISGCAVSEMADILKGYKTSEEEFNSAKEATKALARPSAVKDIIGIIK